MKNKKLEIQKSLQTNLGRIDAAGNLTEDKDGYEYEYDYENRIVKITKDPNDTVVAEFAYDALGRRIRKIDSIAGETTLYYNNPNWQVLCEYDGSNNAEKLFVYGNYIDEVLLMKADGNDYYYVHDHLYSPVALTDSAGDVIERYEYDAYGEVAVMDASYNPRSSSNYGNNYLFTGRRIDILDTGSLKIQYSRNRYYDHYAGRWLTNDPLGITPNPEAPRMFDIVSQYTDGLNLYTYVANNPVINSDPYGLKCNWCERSCCLWTAKTKKFRGQICGLMWQTPAGWCHYTCTIFYDVVAECRFFGKVCKTKKDILVNCRWRRWPIHQVDVWGMGVCPIWTGGPVW